MNLRTNKYYFTYLVGSIFSRGGTTNFRVSYFLFSCDHLSYLPAPPPLDISRKVQSATVDSSLITYNPTMHRDGSRARKSIFQPESPGEYSRTHTSNIGSTVIISSIHIQHSTYVCTVVCMTQRIHYRREADSQMLCPLKRLL